MLLFYQTADSATHRDNIIIRMRRKYDNTFGIWLSALGTICIIGIGFTTRPTCNGMLQIVEYFNIYVIGRTEFSQQLA